MTAPFLLLAPEDDVAVAIRRVAAGTGCGLDGVAVAARQEIPLGHKMAVRAIPAGERVRKFGVPIGRATRAIEPGELVHVHNLRSDHLVNAVDHAEDWAS